MAEKASSRRLTVVYAVSVKRADKEDTWSRLFQLIRYIELQIPKYCTVFLIMNANRKVVACIPHASVARCTPLNSVKYFMIPLEEYQPKPAL